MAKDLRMTSIVAIAFMDALQHTQIKPTVAFGEQFISALVWLPEYEDVLKKDFQFHKSLLDAVTLLIEDDLKNNWVKTLLGVDSLPIVGDTVTITLDQLITVAKTSNQYPPSLDSDMGAGAPDAE